MPPLKAMHLMLCTTAEIHIFEACSCKSAGYSPFLQIQSRTLKVWHSYSVAAAYRQIAAWYNTVQHYTRSKYVLLQNSQTLQQIVLP